MDVLSTWRCILLSYFHLITDAGYLEIYKHKIPCRSSHQTIGGALRVKKKEIVEVFLGIRQIGSFAAWMQ